MAARPVLVVVVIGDAEVRSAVVRRLAMQGVELLTMNGWDEALFDGPMIRPHSVLVVDDAVAQHADLIERQWQEGRWRRVLALTAPAANDRGWLAHAGRCTPANVLHVLFTDGTCAAVA